jgi:hypothetical protein
VSNALDANDTIKRKAYLEIGFSSKQMFLGFKKHDFYSTNQKTNFLYNGPRYNESYYISGLYSFDVNYNYCITNLNKKHKNVFYVGLNFNVSKYNVLHKIEDFSKQWHLGMESYKYDKHEFNYDLNNLNFGASISYFINFKKITVIQKIGINYSCLFSKNQNYTQYHYYYQNEPTLIPPKVTEIQTTISVVDKIPQSNDFNPNYNIGLAYNIKNVAPFINMEFTHFGKYFNKIYAKLSFGAIIKI